MRFLLVLFLFGLASAAELDLKNTLVANGHVKIVAYLAMLLVGLCGVPRCLAQGTLQPVVITFDGPPAQPAGSAALVQNYTEAGMSFMAISGTDGYIRRGGGVSFYPENGTTYLQASSGDSLQFEFSSGASFGLVSVDLAEYSTVVPDPAVVHFVGYRQDGTVVTIDLTTDGVIDGTGPIPDFQTFTFDNRFRGLTRVEIPTSVWSLDNLIIGVPEPTTLSLLVSSAVLFVAQRFRKAKR